MAKVVKETFLDFQTYSMPLFAKEFSQKLTSSFINLTAFNAAKQKCEEDGKSVQDAGQEMLAQYDYAPERENFLIDQAQKYMECRLRNPNLSHTISLVFLAKLANKIAKMFSFYVMRKYNVPANETLRLKIQEELYTKLFTENDYIKQLAAAHKAKQELRQKPKSEQKKIKQAELHAKAAAARKLAGQVKGIFDEAQCIPRRRR